MEDNIYYEEAAGPVQPGPVQRRAGVSARSTTWGRRERQQARDNARQDISIASLDRTARYLDGQPAALFEGGKEFMATHNLIDVYLRVIKAFNENDAQTIQQQVAPDVKYVFHGQNLVSGVYYGIDGVREIFYKAKELTGGTASFEPIDVLANDTTSNGVGSVSGRKERQ